MNSVCVIALASILTLLVVGCSGGGGSDKGGDGSSPKSKEEALQKLSAQHKANFESWKTQVVKSCDAAEAFGLNSEHKLEQAGVDGAALLNKNNKSVLFADDNSFAIITDYNSFSGIGSTKSEERTDVNGHGYSITAETKREGSHCSVYVYGQKVYETTIAQSFSIGSQFATGKEAKATSAVPQIKILGASGVYEVTQSGIFNLLSQTLKPSKEGQVLIAKKLGLTDEQSESLFKLSSYTSADSSVRIDGEQSAVWSNAESGNLIAQGNVLKRNFDGTHRTLNLEVRLEIPQFHFGDSKNDSDNGNLKLVSQLSISKKDTQFLYSMQALQVSGVAPYDQAESVQCSKDRAGAYVGTSTGLNVIQPSVQAMFSPCRTLYPDIEKISYENGLMKSLIPQVFYGVTPSPQYQYGGWDQVLSKLSLDLINQNKDIRSELDPSGSTKIVRIVFEHLQSLKSELNNSRKLSGSKDLVYQMGLTWSFNGQIVSLSRISLILQAVDNSVDTFKVSSERLLVGLGSQPNSGDDSLHFAQSMDSTYKMEAIKALNLSKELNYTDFEQDVFNSVIQKKTQVDEFKDWSNRFVSIKSEINKYGNVGPVKGELVGLSIKWLKSGEATTQDLSGIYSAINNSIDPFVESTRELIQNLSQSLASNKEALDFARNISSEYKQLALAIRDISKACDFESWGQSFFGSLLQKRSAVEQLRVWNNMWTSAQAFIQREKARTAGEHSSSPEWNRKKILETAVKENWTNLEFTGIESIALVANAKNTCDRYKDTSSQADCAGLGLFSKGEKKFFDPAYNNRYISLSADFNNYMKLMSGFDWTTLRWNLVSEFFGTWEPIWSKCDQNSFNTKAANLKRQISAIVQENDTLKKWDLERQIKETIENCQ
jgi:hypothetical protein